MLVSGNIDTNDNKLDVYIFFGNETVNTNSDINLTSKDIRFGQAIASAGDVNGDGFDDVIVGASSSRAATGPHGAAFIYYGNSSMDTQFDVNLTGNSSISAFA